MENMTSKKIVFSLMLVVFIIAIIIIFDVKFVTSKSVPIHGIMSNDNSVIEHYEESLSRASIPFKVKKNSDGQIQITWEEKYSVQVNGINGVRVIDFTRLLL